MYNKRIPYIDAAAGIMILWMIFQHAVQSAWWIGSGNEVLRGLSPNVPFPYLNFFMPWFFYKSGAFFQKRSVRDLMVKDYRKLMRTFLIWSLIGYAVYLLLGAYDHTLTFHRAIRVPTKGFFIYGFIDINSPLWFLLTLFGVRFAANICMPRMDDQYKHFKFAVIVTIGVLIAFGTRFCDSPLFPRWIANSASGLAFFTLGYWLHGYENQKWFVISCVIGYIGSCIFGWNSVCMYNNVLLEGHYLLWFPSALCGIICFNAVCKCVREWMGKITPPLLFARPCARNYRQKCNAYIRNTLICALSNTDNT